MSNEAILIVDDEKEITDLLEIYLKNENYLVRKFYNPLDALAYLENEPVSLAILDVMMPEMDGFTLCQKIRQKYLFPIIMLTAKIEDIDKIQGLTLGADDYIVKPFNMDVLQTRIRSLLTLREQLKKLYGKRFSPEVMGIEVKSADERFSQKLFDVIEKNISNEKLDVELLCSEIGISRANLYRKLKSITELSPMELIRNKRLEVAAKLLKESEMNVSEIASHLGFNSHSYFSNSFKAFYGCTPTEFVQMNNSQE